MRGKFYITMRIVCCRGGKTDEVLARGIEYELLWNKGDYEKAFALYSLHDQWPDRTYRQQALALLENGHMREADSIAGEIADRNLRASTQARMLFDRQAWQRLAAIKPVNDEQRKWQLVGLAKQNLKSAGRQMEHILNKVDLELPQLNMLVKYYGSINNDVMLAKYAKRLTKLIESETQRLANLTHKAIEDKSPQRARRFLGRLVAINPEATEIKKYQQEIVELDAKIEQPSSKS